MTILLDRSNVAEFYVGKRTTEGIQLCLTLGV